MQIENEFYSTIRPKRRITRGERPLHALRERGVEYVEVRLMDLDPFCPIGITAQTCRFLDIFLLQCLVSDSPPDTPEEISEIGRNQQTVALRGREPGLMLERNGRRAPLSDWAKEVMAQCEPLAAAIDAQLDGAASREACHAMQKLIADAGATPSARVLHAMRRNHENSFVRFVLVESMLHKALLQHLELPREVRERFARLASDSLQKQRELEAADELDFETFRQRYLAHDLLRV